MRRAFLVFVLLVTGVRAAEVLDETVLSAAASARAAGRFGEAVERYRQFALNHSDNPRAAEAHRLAILSAADLLRGSASADRATISESYEALLQEHLRVWHAQATSDDVRMWQGRLLQARRDWPAAAAVFQQVRPTSKNYAESLQLLAANFDRWLKRCDISTAQGSQERARVLAVATKHFQPIITGPGNRWPNPWSDVQQAVAVELAKLHVRYGDLQSPYAVQLLSAALQAAPAPAKSETSENWQVAALTTLVAALTRNGRLAEAQAIADHLTGGQPELLLEVAVIVIQPITAPGSLKGGQSEFGHLALTLIQLIDARSAELDTPSLRRLNDCRAAALAAVGNRTEALAQYATLAEASPNDGDTQERYAALLAASDSADELREALTRWKIVESRSRSGGERWGRARRARIELLTRLGQTAEAEKLERLARRLYPDWNTLPN